MGWQDLVLAGGSAILMIAPLGMVAQPPPLRASVPTCLVLYAFVAVYGSLGMHLAGITTGVSAFVWQILAMKRIDRGK